MLSPGNVLANFTMNANFQAFRLSITNGMKNESPYTSYGCFFHITWILTKSRNYFSNLLISKMRKIDAAPSIDVVRGKLNYFLCKHIICKWLQMKWEKKVFQIKRHGVRSRRRKKRMTENDFYLLSFPLSICACECARNCEKSKRETC